MRLASGRKVDVPRNYFEVWKIEILGTLHAKIYHFKDLLHLWWPSVVAAY